MVRRKFRNYCVTGGRRTEHRFGRDHCLPDIERLDIGPLGFLSGQEIRQDGILLRRTILNRSWVWSAFPAVG